MVRMFTILAISLLGACSSQPGYDSSSWGAAMMVLGQGVQNAGQAYTMPQPYVIAPLATHCFQMGPTFSCQQW